MVLLTVSGCESRKAAKRCVKSRAATSSIMHSFNCSAHSPSRPTTSTWCYADGQLLANRLDLHSIARRAGCPVAERGGVNLALGVYFFIVAACNQPISVRRV